MKDKVFTIEEAKNNTPEGHCWDSIKQQTISSFRDDEMYHFTKIDYTLASIFAAKYLSVNFTSERHCPVYELYPLNYNTGNDTCHDAYFALVSRVVWHFKEKFNVNINHKKLRYMAQFDMKTQWMLVADKKSKQALVFCSI